MTRFALVQLEEYEERERALEHAIGKIEKAINMEAEFICLPEKWHKKEITSTELSIFIELSKNICIIPGSFIENIDGEYYISSPAICNGEIIGKQLKIHPFISEKGYVKSGNKLDVFEYNNIKFGIVICHDIVFPEISRRLALKGVDVIFSPSKIYDNGIYPWHVYLQARALENRLAIVAPNICNNGFGGRSMIVRLSYNERLDIAETDIVQASTNAEQILVSDINIESLRRIRSIRMNELRNDYSLM